MEDPGEGEVCTAVRGCGCWLECSGDWAETPTFLLYLDESPEETQH